MTIKRFEERKTEKNRDKTGIEKIWLKCYLSATAVSTDGPAKPVKSRDFGLERPVLHLDCTFEMLSSNIIKVFVCRADICRLSTTHESQVRN